ncbi:PREDICTED: NADH dehydrogenase [ubiquinone] 1 beta subcomplex subunit 4 [Nanorana parkeri]|uniref:NADH dehydrogenase [ubiquinone] 1 beta subcomplex subunit 4 n=1 Tax=Nanorana parkeri TaxID=125878 RepID=UPI000854A5E7|nr:PREDICTED: NADH dehydrogenase [ubiquinone] 1 beta subcomplex subunit 4 [Nanorana parkeri]
MAEYKDSRYASRPAELDPAQYFGLSQEKRKLQEERVAVRSRLKRDYQLQLNDPLRKGSVPDPAVERWMFSRNYNIYPNFRATPKMCLLGAVCTVGPMLFLYTLISWDRKRVLKMYEDGTYSSPWGSNF